MMSNVKLSLEVAKLKQASSIRQIIALLLYEEQKARNV
jgi:hypothetical protein